MQCGPERVGDGLHANISNWHSKSLVGIAELCLSSSAKFRGPAKPLAHVGDFVPAGAAVADPFASERRTAARARWFCAAQRTLAGEHRSGIRKRLRWRRRRGTKSFLLVSSEHQAAILLSCSFLCSFKYSMLR